MLELKEVEPTLEIASRRFLGSGNERACVFAFHFSLFTFHNLVSHALALLISARAAKTIIRMAPSAPTCQSGEMRIKFNSVPASVRVRAPITAPIGETRPPTNSPPPRITPAIESSVYPFPMLASAEVVKPIKARPAKTPKTPAKLNITTLVFSNDQPARPIASGLPPEPRRMAPYEVRIRPR